MSDKTDVIVIGSGLGGLIAGSLLSSDGLRVKVIEQNYQPGGCTTSYWRKGYIFESGATTVVGLDEGMPLQFAAKKLGIDIPVRRLKLPMQIHFSDGRLMSRFNDIDAWKEEVAKRFPEIPRTKSDRFWDIAYRLSQKIWQVSTRHRWFPPTRLKDLWQVVQNIKISDATLIPYAFLSVEQMLRKFELDSSPAFRQFIDAQLLITAQNTAENTNFLFGSAALCYTNFSNFYVDGGLLQLVKPFADYISGHNGEVIYREKVEQITRSNGHYVVDTGKAVHQSDFIIGAIPGNNMMDIYPNKKFRLMPSENLWSAFQIGIGVKHPVRKEAIHHQVLLDDMIPGIGSSSYFISTSHPDDTKRADEQDHSVISISTHIGDPAKNMIDEKAAAAYILNDLIRRGFIDNDEAIGYYHTSGPRSWQKWTGRKWGFVGGYPQDIRIKPWQMGHARWDGYKAYLCGDSVYPGQGIPGVSLSGLIAYEKLKLDWLN